MPGLSLDARKAGFIESGMWVKDADGRVGIFTIQRIKKYGDGGVILGVEERPEVHYTDELGQTVVAVPCKPEDLAKLTQAALSDIPEVRRPHPEHGARLGYV